MKERRAVSWRALALVVCLIGAVRGAVGADDSAEEDQSDYFVASVSKPSHRPTYGLVKAQLVDVLPTMADLRGAARTNAHMLDGVRAPSPLSETHFESSPILSSAEKEAAARGPVYFTPEPMAPPAPAAPAHEAEAESTATEAMVSTPIAMDSYIEVEDGVELMTEDERVAMLEARARVRGPRKYMQFAEASNTGAVLQRYPKQSIRSCMRLCEFDARCVGFTAMRDPKNENGVCTLRSSWGSNIDNPKKDSYQAIEYSVDKLPFRDLQISPRTSDEQKLLIIADVTRVRPEKVQRNAELLITVDGEHAAGIWTNAPANYGDREAYSSPSWAGMTRPLKSGLHTVRVDYLRSGAAVKPVQEDDAAGCVQQRLTSIALPAALDRFRVFDVVGEQWNVGATSSITAQTWTAIPAPAMKVKVATFTEGTSLFVLADISRAQHSQGWTNSKFRIVVDGREVGYTNTGEHYGWQYHPIALRAASRPLKKGEHTVEVQAMTQAGRLYLINDGNGFQQRRLTVLMVPKGQIWNRVWNAATAFGNGKEWRALPGGEMSLTLTTETVGYLFLSVSISRVQNWGTDNCELRVLLDGEEVARTNTGNTNNWRFHEAVFHGVSKAVVQPGEHAVAVQFRSRAASTIVFYNDGNGQNQRRLTAILFPPSSVEHLKQFDGGGFCKDQH